MQVTSRPLPFSPDVGLGASGEPAAPAWRPEPDDRLPRTEAIPLIVAMSLGAWSLIGLAAWAVLG